MTRVQINPFRYAQSVNGKGYESPVRGILILLGSRKILKKEFVSGKHA